MVGIGFIKEMGCAAKVGSVLRFPLVSVTGDRAGGPLPHGAKGVFAALGASEFHGDVAVLAEEIRGGWNVGGMFLVLQGPLILGALNLLQVRDAG